MTGKILVFYISSCLYEVVAYNRWSHIEVQLYQTKCLGLFISFRNIIFISYKLYKPNQFTYISQGNLFTHHFHQTIANTLIHLQYESSLVANAFLLSVTFFYFVIRCLNKYRPDEKEYEQQKRRLLMDIKVMRQHQHQQVNNEHQ